MVRLRNITYLIVITMFVSAGRAQDLDPLDLADQAKSYEKKGKIVEAYLLYAQAAALDPHDKKLWAHAEALQTRAALIAKVAPPATISTIDSLDAESGGADVPPPTAEELKKDREPQPPAELTGAKPGRRNFDLRGDSKNLWENVTKEFGLEVVFDGDYEPIRNLRFQVNDVDYRDALYALIAATNTFVVPISERVILVVKDDQAKRVSSSVNVAMEAPIPDPVSLQEAQELGKTVQQAMEIQRFYIDGAHRVAVFRDRLEKALPARLLFLQLLHRAPQVALDVQFLTTDKASDSNIGLMLPGSFSIGYFGKWFGNPTPLSASGVGSFLVFGGMKTLFGIAPFSGGLFAQGDNSLARSILQTELTTLDGQAVQFHVGDKYPIQSSSYTVGLAAGVNPGFAPSFTFEDLGMILKITPKVHGVDEVSLELDVEFKAISGSGENGLPIISNRKFATTVRLRFDECAVVSGLMTKTEAVTLTGIAGLAGLPVIGPALSQTQKNKDVGEALLLIQPRLLSIPGSESVPHAIFVGAEGKMRTPL